ncbi:FIST N-terminal domain-containing protein [Aquincola sp. MAHUQ-54]|uniref:FIST N-terminal domain-containing protein n=1 Tax=Aquincola agrisoli TaxID=3119538 RepID=A0AAW9QDE4_9BURK
MTPFIHAHATHPDWRMALALAAAQIDAQRALHADAPPFTLGFVYFSDHYAPHAEALLDELRQRWPGLHWTGSVGVGVAASGVEYIDEPALALMLAPLPTERFQVFSGAQPLGAVEPYTALVHADPSTHDLSELIAELSERTASGYLFGGLAAGRSGAMHIADAVCRGGLSGVGFTRDVPLLSRVTQGCQPVGPVRRVTAAQRNVVTELDGRPALDCLLEDLGIGLDDPRAALPRLRATLVGLSDGRSDLLTRAGQFGTDTRVRHLIGLDPGARGIAVADLVEPGMQLAFCARDTAAARRDLVRICAEIREELEPELLPAVAGGPQPPADPLQRVAGAIYISCAGRGGPHFGAPSAELQIVQHALGDVPLVGFFAGGEIGHRHLYGYTGVLTVFLHPA